MKTLNYFIIIFCCLIFFSPILNAQTYYGDLSLTTQTAVDNFDYTLVTGTLTIQEALPDDITNLGGLSELTSVQGLSIIQNTALTNLDGLSNLSSLAILFIRNNSALSNIDALNSVTAIQYIMIDENSSLLNINGLSNVSGHIPGWPGSGWIIININSSLNSIDGLSGFTYTDGYIIISRCAITNLDGLSNLTHVGGDLQIHYNDFLTNTKGLSNLGYVGGNLNMYNNYSLTLFCGLYELLLNQGLVGSYNVWGNGSNPTIEDIIAAGPCEYNIMEGFENLTLAISELPIGKGSKMGLTKKIDQAEEKFNKGDLNTAVKMLNAFINQVNNLVADNVLTQEQADILLDYANDLIDAINTRLPKNKLETDTEVVPNEYSLYQNYPNPFNPSTTINYSIPNSSFVQLIVYNSIGQEIATLVNEITEAGNHTVDFDAGNLPSGIYLYKLQAGSFVETKKMIVMK